MHKHQDLQLFDFKSISYFQPLEVVNRGSEAQLQGAEICLVSNKSVSFAHW